MSLVSGPIFQICWVVEDIDASEAWFTETLGVPRWMRIPNVHFGPDTCTLRGAPADFVIDVSMGYAGAQQLELIRPVSGESLYAEHLARSGPGLHHVAWVPDDFDATVADALARGIVITQQGSFGDGAIAYAYLDGSAAGAPHIELMRQPPELLAAYEALKDEAYRSAPA
jgi:catechol 2,3-dioxygenase-like lactoylglutathione lyase family enzyme